MRAKGEGNSNSNRCGVSVSDFKDVSPVVYHGSCKGGPLLASHSHQFDYHAINYYHAITKYATACHVTVRVSLIDVDQARVTVLDTGRVTGALASTTDDNQGLLKNSVSGSMLPWVFVEDLTPLIDKCTDA